MGEEGLGSLGDLLIWRVSKAGTKSQLQLNKRSHTWLGSTGETTASDALTTAVDLDIFAGWDKRWDLGGVDVS